MRANTDETIKRGSALREKHGSWVSVARQSRNGHFSSDKGAATRQTKEKVR